MNIPPKNRFPTKLFSVFAATLTAAAICHTSLADVPSHEFTYTGSPQTWTVPDGVTSVTIRAFGGKGGLDNGGKGARIQGTLAVTPGQVLDLNVYDKGGEGGPSAGAGGGGSMVAREGTTLMIAGGGGGGSYYGSYEGGIGGTSSQPGGNNYYYPSYGASVGGGAGTASAPGDGGSPNGVSGVSHSGGDGGAGGDIPYGGGGGGGGYFGGGGGGGNSYYGAGGGGGSNFLAEDITSQIIEDGKNAGAAKIVIFEGTPPVLPKALVNGNTVSGGVNSLEAQQAEAAGFDVNVVDGATWDAMTQAEFAAYQVLIIGDPTCGTLDSSVTANASTWVPVVMGTAVHSLAGNRILVGTDPVYHNGGHPSNIHLLNNGIKFAGTFPGRTGLYLDATCGDNGDLLALLAQLSVGSGTWTKNPYPPCGGSASLIASNPAFSDLTSADLQGWSCSVHETFPTFPDDWNALAVATDTESKPTCGTDPSTGATACGESYILIAGSGILVTSPDISLTPGEATNPVNTDHTVTAHVTSPVIITGAGAPNPPHAASTGTPVVGQTVTFTVTGQNSGATGTCSPSDCKTDANGEVTFTYHDTNGAGDDTITASFTDGNGTKQQANAIKHWSGGNPCDSDTTKPTITAPADVVADGNIVGSCGANVDPGTPTAEDNCTLDTVIGTRSDSLALTDPYPQGVTTITWTAKDKAGNTASTQSTVTINNPAPVAFIDKPINNANFHTRRTVPFAGHYTDNSGGTHTAKWTLTCDRKAGCVGVITATVMPDKTITGAFRFPKNSQANYTVVLTVDDGCGGTANSLPIVIHVTP